MSNMRKDNRQYIEDFETYVMFRRIVKMDVFHLKFRLSSSIISHLLAEDMMVQVAFDDDQKLNASEYKNYYLPASYSIISQKFKEQNSLPPDYNTIW